MMHTTEKKVAILGAGSWGTALALNAARVAHQQVYLWGHDANKMQQIEQQRENKRYLANITLPDNITATADLSVIYDCDMLLLVVPSHAFSEMLERIAPFYGTQALGWAIKGFDPASNTLLSDTFQKRYPDRDFAVLAGPSFAKEVANALPTAVTVASPDFAYAELFTQFLHNKHMRTYLSDDVIGAQLGGALKNVMAIATGISDGLGFGANTRAALITRGLREISRIGQAAGAEQETLMGLSGLGDLLLTCTDDLSRNRRFGLLLGQGKNIEEALAIIGQTVEGLRTAKEAEIYTTRLGVRAPIIHVVAKILKHELSINEAMNQLLSHAPKPEND